MIAKIIPAIFLLAGFFVLVQIAIPVINFKLWELANIEAKNILVSPISESNRVLGVSIQNTRDNFPALISFSKREFIPYT